MKVLLVSLFDEWCLGIRYLASYLEAHGHEAVLAFLGAMPDMHGRDGEGDAEGYHVPPASVSGADFRALEALARDQAPGLIGISLTSNFSGLAARVTERLRRAGGAPIVWGGIDPTVNPDLAIEHADYVCIGEGEEALLELVEALSRGGDTRQIANIWARVEGVVHRNPVRPLIENLDALPWPDFRPDHAWYVHGGEARRGFLPAESDLWRQYPIVTGRGCPYRCTFCCNSVLRDLYGERGYVRLRSVGNVIGEIRNARSQGLEFGMVSFQDDVFGFRQEWLDEFAATYPGAVGLPFFCWAHPETTRPARVATLKRAGVAIVQMGIQSGSRRMLREMYHRYTKPEQVVAAAQNLTDAGVPYMIDLINGHALEREEDFRATLDLLLSLPAGFLLHPINHLGLYRNYPITGLAETQGIAIEWLPGRNAAEAPTTPASRFWNALLTMTQFPELDPTVLRTLGDDPYLREHPEALEGVAGALGKLAYLPGTHRRVAQDRALLRQELDSLRGSRLVRGALTARELVRDLRAGLSG